MIPDFMIKGLVEDGTLGIEPFQASNIQPASYDMTLDQWIRVYPRDHIKGLVLDVKNPAPQTDLMQMGGSHRLRSGGFMLAATVESLKVPANMVGRVEGKSSLARLGLFVHVTAGFIDPGFNGPVTLELFNGNNRDLILYPGMPICQISFDFMVEAARKPYSGKYQNADPGPTESRYWRNFL